MSEWKDLVDKINSAKLGNKYIEDSLQGLVYRYYNDGDKACDSRNDPYGYATKYFNTLRDFINDSEIDDIMYKPRIKYETKLKILIDYVCDAYGKNSTKESKKSARKSIEESKEINLIDNVANKLRKITDAYVDTYRGADWISLGKDEYTIKIIYMRNELSIELYKDGDFKDGELEYASSLSDDDFSVNYIIDFIKNFIKNRNYLKNKISIKESKEFTRKSIKESSDIADKIASEIDKSYWIDKLIDDLDRHYEAMEKAWLKNLDKLSDEDILGIIDDCMGKSKTLVGKSEMLKNKMIDDLSKAYDDYIDDIDRQIRIGKSEDEVKDMIETTLENDIKMYLKLAYNNKASSNYFMVKFAEDNLI